MSETGTASSGIIEARHVWRKISTTSTTSSIASQQRVNAPRGSIPA